MKITFIQASNQMDVPILLPMHHGNAPSPPDKNV